MNFLGTLHATPDDRFTVKFINNNLDTRLPIRLSLNQYYQNPFQQGCDMAGVAGCGSVSLFNNGFNGNEEFGHRRAGGPWPRGSPHHRRRAMGA